jgi:hypothetical protein
MAPASATATRLRRLAKSCMKKTYMKHNLYPLYA